MLRFEIDEFYIYPLKSVSPVKLDKLELSREGLKYDRNWMIVTSNGMVVTQREFPQLNKIKCIDQSYFYTLKIEDSGFQDISFKKDGHLEEELEVCLWGTKFKAYKTQSLLSEWFSEYLSEKVFIVSSADRTKLTPDNRLVPLSFQDSMPVHLINLKSVTDLSSRCGLYIDPMRFRANIYLDMKIPYEEDTIKEIIINDKKFIFVKPCERCIMVNLTPNQINFSKEPLLSLSQYRKFDNKVVFGIYLALDSTII